MFREEFVVGMAYGDLVRDAQSPLGARIWWLRSLDSLVSLAEALGVVRVETPEQGRVGVAFDDGVAGVVVAIERKLGMDHRLPRCRRRRTGSGPGRASWHLTRPSRSTPPSGCVTPFAGTSASTARAASSRSVRATAAMAYWFLRLCPAAERYRIVDLPIVNVLQGYFLSQALGEASVSFLGEPGAPCRDPAEFAPRRNRGALSRAGQQGQHAGGCRRAAMVGYLEWARSTCDGILFSYNQEGGATFDGEPQNLVPRAVDRVGGFARVQRDLSWVRRGYVEEIYTRADRPAP